MFGQKKNLSMVKVFTPGGFPTITYIDRKEKQLERQVCAAQENLAKLVVVTGATKSGKTVLVDKVFPQAESLWIDGGTISDENSFWESVIEKADLFTETESSEQDTAAFGFESEAAIEGNVFIAKGTGAFRSNIGTEQAMGTTYRRAVNPKVIAIHKLQAGENALIVDDFHYIDKEVQRAIVRALKAPIMHGLPVIFIAIPNRRYDAVEVEREMTGRIENIEMPVWEEKELEDIARLGFKSLNVRISDSLIRSLASAAYGSPFLMQEFCRELCRKCEIEGYSKEKQFISDALNIEDVFIEIAEHSGRPMFNTYR